MQQAENKGAHTRGPWHWDMDLVGETGIATLRTPDGFILRTKEPTRHGFPPEADARLIAAAPDLAEACRMTVARKGDYLGACCAALSKAGL